jgi:ketosteroid isomerase-like protein
MPLLLLAAVAAAASAPAPSSDHDIVAALDRSYQAAVKRNDAAAMDRILHPQFQLVVGTGRRISRDDLLGEARRGSITYELQDEADGSQSVLVAGDTAVVTAKLFIKGTTNGEKIDRTLWFSDTYVRTPSGWLYLFGQASLPLPAPQQ